MNRLSKNLQANLAARRKNLVTFITAGDPDLATSLALMHGLVAGGVDVIELGVPFSDPMADGPVIQRASERAILNGVNLQSVFGLVRDFRATNQHTPVVLMGYANPIERMGQGAFIEQAVAAGVDGALIVDYPPEESEAFSATAKQAGLSVIYLIAPTSTPARMQSTANLASGFIYYVSIKGVTGSATLDVSEVAHNVAQLRQYTDLPINVGFGISDAASAQKVAQVSDGVVIGSKLITMVEDALASGHNGVQLVSEWVADIRQALDEVGG
jgi:tryptophan synthase alpha chain